MATVQESRLGVREVFDALRSNGVTFFTGVPDSLLKDICAYITDNLDGDRHIIAANEGAAVALAAGHYLATRELSVVYLQNSGLGNTINPLLSLADPEVYSIPMVLLIGWRGEPGVKDEPQHIKQGRVMLPLLESMELPYAVLETDPARAAVQIEEVCRVAVSEQTPYALVVRAGTFEPYKLARELPNPYPLTREEAIRLVLGGLDERAAVVSTTGKASREVFEYRVAQGEGHERDFLTVGSMGHCSQIALGLSLRQPDRQVYCLDGDGSVLMHMGSLAVIGANAGPNFKHIVINNGAHESVGGQPTVGFALDLPAIARGCGYRESLEASTPSAVEAAVARLAEIEGPALLEIRVNIGSRKDLGRPTQGPLQNRDELMAWLAR